MSSYNTRSKKSGPKFQTVGSVPLAPEDIPVQQEAMKADRSCSYQEVVAPCTVKAVTASAVLEKPETQVRGISSSQEPGDKVPVSNISVGNNQNISSPLELTSQSDEDDGHWTTVGPRRSRSLNNLTDYKSGKYPKHVKLSKEQKATVQAAEKILTPTQRDLICKCSNLIQQRRVLWSCRPYSELTPNLANTL